MMKPVKEIYFQLEKKKQYMVEQFWLLYYNQYLFDHGLITEQERNRMTHRINNRKVSLG